MTREREKRIFFEEVIGARGAEGIRDMLSSPEEATGWRKALKVGNIRVLKRAFGLLPYGS